MLLYKSISDHVVLLSSTEDINIEDGPWDIHVITGSLKLFFRELQEPLFPFSHFNNFIAGISEWI